MHSEISRSTDILEIETILPPITKGNAVTPLINGNAYISALAADIHKLGLGSQAENEREFLYLTGYVQNWVQPDAPLLVPGLRGQIPLIDLIKEKARAGVDVRVLAWIPWNLSLAGKLDLRPESGDNMRTILALRQEPALAQKACLNITAHPAGSAHQKMVVMGSPYRSVGYSGGIDLSPDRLCPEWLDVQARVEGPAVQAMYDLFRSQWNENRIFASTGDTPFLRRLRHFFRAVRPVSFSGRGGRVISVPVGTPTLEPRTLTNTFRGPHRVQSLITMPAFRFAFNPINLWLNVAGLPHAPKGIFQIHAAIQQALSHAERYIYIEDQYLWSDEIMKWINQAVRRQPKLQVILLTGISNQLGERLSANRTKAVVESLLPGLTAEQRAQIVYYQHSDNIHTKTMLVDDRWALIGSANIAQRSLYTDIEHALAVEDPTGILIASYRAALWTNRQGFGPDGQEQALDLARALSLWEGSWGKPWQGARPQSRLQRIYTDMPALPQIDRVWYRMVDDPDSRQPWFFPLRINYARFLF